MESVRKNYIYNVIYEMLAIVLPLITAPYISRTLEAESLGVYTYTFSIASYFTIFSMLGISNYGVRTIARVRNDRAKLSEEFSSIYALQFISASIVTICYYIYVAFISKSFFSAKMLQSILVISFVFDVSWFFFGIEKFKLTVLRNIIIRIISVILVFIFVRSPEDLWKHIIIMAVSTLINQLSLWTFLPKYVDFKKPTLKKILSHLKPALVLLIPSIAVGLYVVMDKVMIGGLADMSDKLKMQEVAYYYNAEKIANIPMGLIVAFGNVMMPRTAYLAEQGKHSLVLENIRKSMRFNIFLSSAITFGIAAVGPMFAPLFFGAEFVKSGQLVVYLSIIIIFKSWANILRKQYLIPYNKDNIFIGSVVAGAVVNLVINYLLIPIYGAFGAVIGTIIAEFVVALYQTIAIWDIIDSKRYVRENFIYLISGAIMLLAILFVSKYMSKNFVSILIQVGFGAIIYLLVSYLLTPNKEELKESLLEIKGKLFKKF